MPRPAITVLACVVLGGFLAGCSGQQTQAPSHPAQSDGGGRGVSSSEVTVAGLASLTSPTGATLPGSDIGARAVFARVNAAGGVHGRRINFLGVRDDGGQAASDLAAAQSLVQRDGVFAVVPAVTTVLGAVSFLQSNGVPTIGYMPDPGACAKTFVFSVTGCSAPPSGYRVYSPAPGLVLAQGAFHGDAAGRTVAVAIDDSPSGHASTEACRGPFSTAGFKVPGSPVYVPPGATSYAPYAEQIIRSAGGAQPDVVWACTDFDTTLGLTTALRAAGYQGLVYSPVTYDPRVLQVPTLHQLLDGTDSFTVFPPAEAATAAMEKVKRNVQAVDPSATLSLPVLAGYYSAELFVQALRKTGRDLTARRFAQAANSKLTFDADGALCPISFPAAHTQGAVGGGLVQLGPGGYVPLVPLLCRPMSDNVHF